MRLTVIIVFLIFGGVNSVRGQVSFTAEQAAKRAFERFSYAKASILYKDVLRDADDSVGIIEKIVDCHRFLNEPDSVETYLSMAIDRNKELPSVYYYYYAEALVSLQQYQQSKEWYEYYNDLIASDGRTSLKLDALENIDRFFRDSSEYQVSPISINTPGLDFSPAIYKDGIVFVSSRTIGDDWIQRDFNWDETSFLDLFYAHGDELSQIEYLSPAIKSKFHEGPVAFFDNQTKMAFTRNNYQGGRVKRDKKGVARLKIYFAEYDEQARSWGKIRSFQFNNDQYSVGHPAMSNDGSVIIFSSDKPGGIGGTDLYVSYKNADKWTEPEDLGALINSKGQEMFPVLIDQQLFYATDGRGGLGGLDIYKVDLDENYRPKSEPKNMGYPINSGRDDFGFTATSDFSVGYFTSARNPDNKDDIYKFAFEEKLRKGQVLDQETNEPIALADVFMVDSLSGFQIYVRSDQDGMFVIPRQAVDLTISASKYNYRLENAAVAKPADEDKLVVYLSELDPPLDFPMPMQEYLMDYDTLLTDSLIAETLIDSLLIKPIYFDLDKYELRPESIAELDKVYEFMRRHPRMILELGSHTDIRKDDEYNMNLSQKRATSTYEYLVGLGIDYKRLSPRGYGESQPIVDCEGRDCSEVEHQSNRRNEFTVIGLIEE
ncbi:MAG: OmpA family protein [Cyclobacteriaceae bacterium]